MRVTRLASLSFHLSLTEEEDSVAGSWVKKRGGEWEGDNKGMTQNVSEAAAKVGGA